MLTVTAPSNKQQRSVVSARHLITGNVLSQDLPFESRPEASRQQGLGSVQLPVTKEEGTGTASREGDEGRRTK